MLNRQQLCVALAVSESTIRRLEQNGLPYTPIGSRSKRYDLEECKRWLQNNGAVPRVVMLVSQTAELDQRTAKFLALCRTVKLRVRPSES